MIRKILNYMLRAADYNLVKTRGDVLYDACLNNTNRILELEAERDYLDAKCAELEAEKEQVCEWEGKEYQPPGMKPYCVYLSPHDRNFSISTSHKEDYQFCHICGKRIVYKDGE